MREITRRGAIRAMATAAGTFGLTTSGEAVASQPRQGQDQELLQDRIMFSTQTGDDECGGTDGDVLMQLIGNNNVRYPAQADRWYILDNGGNDRERSHRDDYWFEDGSIRPVHTARLWFSRAGDNPEWDLEWASVSRWKWEPVLGVWHVAEVLNLWSIFFCFRDNGIIEASNFVDVLSDRHPESKRFAAARKLLKDDLGLANAVSDLINPRRRQRSNDPVRQMLGNLKSRVTPTALSEKNVKTIPLGGM